MFADKPHRLNGRTSAQRFCVLTILPPVTALAVGLPAQRAIAQRFRALARNRQRRLQCAMSALGVQSGKHLLAARISPFDPPRTSDPTLCIPDKRGWSAPITTMRAILKRYLDDTSNPKTLFSGANRPAS